MLAERTEKEAPKDVLATSATPHASEHSAFSERRRSLRSAKQSPKRQAEIEPESNPSAKRRKAPEPQRRSLELDIFRANLIQQLQALLQPHTVSLPLVGTVAQQLHTMGISKLISTLRDLANHPNKTLKTGASKILTTKMLGEMAEGWSADVKALEQENLATLAVELRKVYQPLQETIEKTEEELTSVRREAATAKQLAETREAELAIANQSILDLTALNTTLTNRSTINVSHMGENTLARSLHKFLDVARSHFLEDITGTILALRLSRPPRTHTLDLLENLYCDVLLHRKQDLNSLFSSKEYNSLMEAGLFNPECASKSNNRKGRLDDYKSHCMGFISSEECALSPEKKASLKEALTGLLDDSEKFEKTRRAIPTTPLVGIGLHQLHLISPARAGYGLFGQPNTPRGSKIEPVSAAISTEQALTAASIDSAYN